MTVAAAIKTVSATEAGSETASPRASAQAQPAGSVAPAEPPTPPVPAGAQPLPEPVGAPPLPEPPEPTLAARAYRLTARSDRAGATRSGRTAAAASSDRWPIAV